MIIEIKIPKQSFTISAPNYLLCIVNLALLDKILKEPVNVDGLINDLRKPETKDAKSESLYEMVMDYEFEQAAKAEKPVSDEDIRHWVTNNRKPEFAKEQAQKKYRHNAMQETLSKPKITYKEMPQSESLDEMVMDYELEQAVKAEKPISNEDIRDWVINSRKSEIAKSKAQECKSAQERHTLQSEFNEQRQSDEKSIDSMIAAYDATKELAKKQKPTTKKNKKHRKIPYDDIYEKHHNMREVINAFNTVHGR